MANHKLQRFHTDGAGELCQDAPKIYANRRGHTIKKTAKGSPRSNGCSEIAIGILKICARVALRQAKLPNSYWSYAVEDCAAKLNKITKKNSKKSHGQLFFNDSETKIQSLLPFGTLGYIPNKVRKPPTLTPRGLLRRFLGTVNPSIMRVLDPVSNTRDMPRQPL